MNDFDRLVIGAILGLSIVTSCQQLPSIERKLDAMNTCGPAEVVVSGEGE